MRIKDIVIGKYYRHKKHPNYCYARVLKILKPHELENTNSYTVVKCEWIVSKQSTFGILKYFRPEDLIEDKNGL